MRDLIALATRLSLTIAVLAFAGAVQAQDSPRPPGGLLGGIFGGGERSGGDQSGQPSQADVVVRLDGLERQVRQLTGEIEQLQFRNRQLEQALQRMPNGNEALQQAGTGNVIRSQPVMPPQAAQPMSAPAAPADNAASARPSDVFNPALHPNAPGVPRPLGSSAIVAPEPNRSASNSDVGAPGGREPGSPLDLSTVSGPTAGGGSGAMPRGQGEAALPPPPPRDPSATGANGEVQPPTRSPKDEYDLAYGYLLRKDYALAENAFRNFLRDHPRDRLAADATYWLGESRFQRQRFRDAAESFLTVTTKHEKSSKAPDALYRLGQSLAAMGEKEAACAALGEVARKYPRASPGVRRGVVQEQKRVHC